MDLPHGNSQKVFGIYNSLQMAGLLAALALGLTEVKIGDKERDRAHGGAVQFRTVLRQTICCKELLLFLIALAFLAEAHQTITVSSISFNMKNAVWTMQPLGIFIL